MQAFKTLFSRTSTQAATSHAAKGTTQPVELSTESLKLVGGGLPRVGGLGGNATVPAEGGSTSATLPSVS